MDNKFSVAMIVRGEPKPGGQIRLLLAGIPQRGDRIATHAESTGNLEEFEVLGVTWMNQGCGDWQAEIHACRTAPCAFDSEMEAEAHSKTV